MQTVKSTLLVLLFSSLSVACGLKGPLYLPDDEPVARPVTTPSSAAEEEKEEKEEKNEDDSEI